MQLAHPTSLSTFIIQSTFTISIPSGHNELSLSLLFLSPFSTFCSCLHVCRCMWYSQKTTSDVILQSLSLLGLSQKDYVGSPGHDENSSVFSFSSARIVHLCCQGQVLLLFWLLVFNMISRVQRKVSVLTRKAFYQLRVPSTYLITTYFIVTNFNYVL